MAICSKNRFLFFSKRKFSLWILSLYVVQRCHSSSSWLTVVLLKSIFTGIAGVVWCDRMEEEMDAAYELQLSSTIIASKSFGRMQILTYTSQYAANKSHRSARIKAMGGSVTTHA